MFTNPTIGLRYPHAHLDELRRGGAIRPVTGSAFASTLGQLGHLVESATSGDRLSREFDRAVRDLVDELVTIAHRAGIPGLPLHPSVDDPFVAVLRAVGRLAAITAASVVPVDARHRARLRRHLDRVGVAVSGNDQVAPLPHMAAATPSPGTRAA